MAVPAIFVTCAAERRRFASGKACASCIRMNNITSFRDLLVWQKSMDLAVRCYKTAQKLPKADQMVLGYQI